jgi:hypothetical protein
MKPTEKKPFHVHEDEENLVCNACDCMMDSAECRNVCLNCGLFVGECQECMRYSTRLLYWSFSSQYSADQVSTIIKIADPKIDDDESGSTSDDPGIQWALPPYKAWVSNNTKYVDDSTRWIFWCDHCAQRAAYCD